MTEFFIEDNGHAPVEEFLDSLDLKTRARFRWSMERLRVRNVRAREPLVRHLEGDLWELREKSQTNVYRIIYFSLPGGASSSCTVFKSNRKRRRVKNANLPRDVTAIFSHAKEGGDRK